MKKFAFGIPTFKKLRKQDCFCIKTTELIYKIDNEDSNPYYAWSNNNSISIGLNYIF